MLSRQELFKTREYWIDRIQNDIFRALHFYQEEHDLNQSQLAKKLEVSKGYVSQVLNGNFNFSISKLVDLSLSIGVVPEIELKPIQEFIVEEEIQLERMREPSTYSLISLNTGSQITLEKEAEEIDPLKIAG